MKIRLLGAAICGLGIWVSPVANAFDQDISHSTCTEALQAAFSPWDDVEKLITDEIGNAKRQVLMQAYLLTSKKIASALISAHRRGADVRIMVDNEQARNGPEEVYRLAKAGIPIRVEMKYQHAHNKVIIIDAGTSCPIVITGSYNFTWSAQHRNAENVLIVRNSGAVAARYTENWNRHFMDSVPLKM